MRSAPKYAYLTMIRLCTSHDSSTLQNDISRLSTWETRWDMQFNPSKCQVVQAKGSKQPAWTDFMESRLSTKFKKSGKSDIKIQFHTLRQKESKEKSRIHDRQTNRLYLLSNSIN